MDYTFSNGKKERIFTNIIEGIETMFTGDKNCTKITIKKQGYSEHSISDLSEKSGYTESRLRQLAKFIPGSENTNGKKWIFTDLVAALSWLESKGQADTEYLRNKPKWFKCCNCDERLMLPQKDIITEPETGRRFCSDGCYTAFSK